MYKQSGLFILFNDLLVWFIIAKQHNYICTTVYRTCNILYNILFHKNIYIFHILCFMWYSISYLLYSIIIGLYYWKYKMHIKIFLYLLWLVAKKNWILVIYMYLYICMHTYIYTYTYLTHMNPDNYHNYIFIDKNVKLRSYKEHQYMIS